MPPKGTAGFARSPVRGIRRLPSPPARTIARTRGEAMAVRLVPSERSGPTSSVCPMRVDLLTREYPPEVYGGAGVHVEYLARELAALEGVTGDARGGEGARVQRAL